MKHNRNYSREMCWKHATRKQWTAKHCYGWDYYDNLHQYSKNKIHCSCPLCREQRTNSPKTFSVSDQKKFDDITDQLNNEVI